jgi:hypothetical protein
MTHHQEVDIRRRRGRSLDQRAEQNAPTTSGRRDVCRAVRSLQIPSRTGHEAQDRGAVGDKARVVGGGGSNLYACGAVADGRYEGGLLSKTNSRCSPR